MTFTKLSLIGVTAKKHPAICAYSHIHLDCVEFWFTSIKMKRAVQPSGRSHTALGNTQTLTLAGSPHVSLLVGGFVCSRAGRDLSAELKSILKA